MAAPLAVPAPGVDRIARFNFMYDKGRAAFDKAEAAAKKTDWAEARKQAEAAVQADANHMDARRLLAIALAQLGEHAAAVDHLVAVIAADYYAYGITFGTEPLLESFRATPHGQAVVQLGGQIRDEYAKKIKNAVLFIARRNNFRYEAKSGVQALTSRGELYAFDRETKRYLRLTHTGHQVAGFVRARTTPEVAVLGFDRGDKPKDSTAPPLVARGWVQTLDTAEWKSTSKITLPSARANAVYYGEGDQLLVAQAPAADRWNLGEWTISSVDRTTNKLTKTTGTLGTPRIELTLDEGLVVLPSTIDGVTGVWTGTPARSPELTSGSIKIVIPESGQAAQESISVAPGGAWIAFATAVDPCAKDAAPSLYVANGKTGALKHLLTARSRFVTRWIDANTLAYEDGDNAIRLWDATTGREAMRIENKPGVSLAVLSLASAPLCKQAPPTEEPAGSGDEMPPEEPSGPITTPQ